MRMSGGCKMGPIAIQVCDYLESHNAATGRPEVSWKPNNCRNCGWCDENWENWPEWDGDFGPH